MFFPSSLLALSLVMVWTQSSCPVLWVVLSSLVTFFLYRASAAPVGLGNVKRVPQYRYCEYIVGLDPWCLNAGKFRKWHQFNTYDFLDLRGYLVSYQPMDIILIYCLALSSSDNVNQLMGPNQQPSMNTVIAHNQIIMVLDRPQCLNDPDTFSYLMSVHFWLHANWATWLHTLAARWSPHQSAIRCWCVLPFMVHL